MWSKKPTIPAFPSTGRISTIRLGILNVKDLLQYVQKTEDINLQALLRPAQFVPDSAPLDYVLRQMQSMHLHMAIVVDEFGGVEGIVTLEDLLEEIVGEIRDEHDTEIEDIRELGPNLYSVAGKLPVKDFNRFFDEKIPEAPEYTTLAGLHRSSDRTPPVGGRDRSVSEPDFHDGKDRRIQDRFHPCPQQ